jgi:plastocyanin
MFRVPLVALAGLAAALLAASSPAAVTQLTGNVGPGFTITLTQGGKKVSSLKPGRYSLAINDKSKIHNFRLTGPGFNKATSVSKIGKTTFSVTLKTGTYRFLCDPHSSSMKGSFKVK